MNLQEQLEIIKSQFKERTRFQFTSRKGFWVVVQVVDRGCVVQKIDGTHQHLAEWISLLQVTIESQP